MTLRGEAAPDQRRSVNLARGVRGRLPDAPRSSLRGEGILLHRDQVGRPPRLRYAAVGGDRVNARARGRDDMRKITIHYCPV